MADAGVATRLRHVRGGVGGDAVLGLQLLGLAVELGHHGLTVLEGTRGDDDGLRGIEAHILTVGVGGDGAHDLVAVLHEAHGGRLVIPGSTVGLGDLAAAILELADGGVGAYALGDLVEDL